MSALDGLLRGAIPEWQGRALRAQTDPDAFYPEKGSNGGPAKAVCRRCEVKDECLDWALTRNEQHGVWGGKTERERTEIKRRAGRTEVAA